MIPRELSAIAGQSPLLASLSDDECLAVLEQGRLSTWQQGEVILHQGDDSTMLYVVVEGHIKLTRITEAGQQVIVNMLGPEDGLGIIVALIGDPYPVSAEAAEDATLIGWNRETISELMSQHQQLALNGLSIVGRRFSQMQARFEELATQRVEQRIARTLLRMVRQFGRRVPDGVLIDMPLSREDLAQMTGTNLYQVSRAMSKWEQAGIISSARKRVTLLVAHELIAIAEDLPNFPSNPKPLDGSQAAT